jgi:2-polyprenyl-6-methoxyphenol hydroxylase-like FAD-dependent oxidoreductase
MTTSDAPRALIIGGSLGGLFAATTLRAIGWQVDIFERSPHDLDSRGGGVVLQPDVLAAFRFAGIQHSGALGVQSGDRIYLDRDDRVVQRSSMPQTQTSWNMLYGAMRRALPTQLIHRGEQFVRFEQTGNKVLAHFASGRVESGELLVGADGPRSTLPDVAPTYAGYVAWRGLVPESRLSDRAKNVLGGTFAFQQGPGHLMLEYMVPGEDESTAKGERRWNWVWYRKVAPGEDFAALMTDRDGKRHAYSVPPGAANDRNVAEMRQASRELLAPTFQDLVEATDEPFVQGILDLQVPQMVFGRAVLIGDSAFIPRPHTAGSTAKAAANAVALAKALKPIDSHIDDNLRDWQEWQLREGVGMTEWGMAMGDRIMGIARCAAPLESS